MEIITFCVNDEPFICEVHGKFTVDILKEIEDQFIEEPPDDWEYNVGTITYKCYWEKPQYGDFGRTEIDGYWNFTEISKVVL